LCYVNEAGFICASHIRYQRHQPRCERKQFAPPEYEMKLEGKRILLVEDEYSLSRTLPGRSALLARQCWGRRRRCLKRLS